MMLRLLPLLLLFCSCVDVAVPDTTPLTCAEGDACPAGFSCNPDIGRCVADLGEDTRPPAITAVVVEPPAGKAGTDFTLTFAVDEPLAKPPVILLDATTPITGSGDVNDPAAPWTFALTAEGEEAQGAHSFTASVVDIFGNAAQVLLPRTATFDFDAPVIRDPGLDAVVDDPELSFRLRLDGAVRVTVTGDVEDDKDLAVREDEAVDVNVDLTAEDGAKTLRFDAFDAVGNTSFLEVSVELDAI